MFRTLDFVLVFTTVAFLVMAIGVTIFTKSSPASTQSKVVLADQVNSDEPAELQGHSSLSRAENLKSMREKIAASPNLSISNLPPETPAEETQEAESQLLDETDKELQLCGDYRVASRNWSPFGIQIEEVEGARIVYKEVQRDVTPDPQATSTDGSVPMVDSYQEILVQLPVRSFPAASKSCIATDVIGIANDGSLIRNSEAGVYGIFGSATLVGYALDGFPIYGSGGGVTDECGGVMGVAGYQYQISSERDTIINCFSGPPVPF